VVGRIDSPLQLMVIVVLVETAPPERTSTLPNATVGTLNVQARIPNARAGLRAASTQAPAANKASTPNVCAISRTFIGM
jgi:hypothetical protein